LIIGLEAWVLFVGNDWAQDHHDVEVQDHTGKRLARARVPDGVEGIARVHALIGRFADPDDPAGPAQVVVGIETDRGPWVTALVAAGYRVFAINPLQVARYRERGTTSGAKSDPGDAHVLADMVRTDAHQLRPIAGDSALVEAIKIVARTHQTLIWDRQRHLARLEADLRGYFPADTSPLRWLRSTPPPPTSTMLTPWNCWRRLRPRRPRPGYRCRGSLPRPATPAGVIPTDGPG
jgi:transposase